MDKIKLKLKSEKDVVLDFSNYTLMEYTLNDITIKLNSKLSDSSNEIFSVDRILIDSIILKDSNNNLYTFPKEEILNFKKVNEMNPKENFNAFNNFKGIGNPNSKIWFVGLEEGGDSISKDNIEEQVKECNKFPLYVPPEKVKITKTQVWDYISKFLIEYLNIKDKDWYSYRQIMFSETDSQFFLAELFPLPKKRFKYWAEEYGEIFGFNTSDFDKYINEVREKRFPMLLNFWKEKKPQITICFGKSGWNYFTELFELSVTDFYGFNNIKIDKNKNVVLIPFLGNGRISDNVVKELAVKLKSV